MDKIKIDRANLTSSVLPQRDEQFWENALRLSAQRMELIASNIANADTPNYKARDIDFKKALAQSMSANALNRVDSKKGAVFEPDRPFLATPLYRIPTQPSVDNNTVDMDAERAAFAQSALMYEFTLQKAIGEYKDMSELFNSLT